jgi:hypothetical protein
VHASLTKEGHRSVAGLYTRRGIKLVCALYRVEDYY